MTDYLFNLSQYDFLRYLAIFFSYIYFYFMPFFVIFWIFSEKIKRMYKFSIIFLSSISTLLLTEFIKILFKINRPETSGLIMSENGFSFPSHHSSLSMVLGIVIYSINKKLGAVFVISSLLIGISRVVLGVHFFTDVLFGWLFGIIVGIIFIKIYKKYDIS